jgi:hypothetical protein
MNLIDTIKKDIVEEGDCWNWTGALQSCGSVPTIRWQGKVGSVRRFVLLDQGVDLTGRLATYTCDNPACVNPEHLAPSTRKRIQVRTVAESGYTSNPLRRKRVSDKARLRGKLTLDQALAIREADGNQYDIAARFGVSQATVSVIKRGVTWQDYTNPFARLAA